MSVSKLLIKQFAQFQGVDYETSDLTREAKYASELLNAEFSGDQAYVKCKGTQIKVGNTGGYGMGVYENINTTTGAVTETPVTTSNGLYTLTDDSFIITYSGSASSLLNIGVETDGSAFTITITEDETSVYSRTLGLGQDEAAAITIATVISEIDALANYVATGGTITTGSAAFLDLQLDTQLSSTASTIRFKRWTAVNEAKSNPLALGYAERNSLTYENPSFVSMNNVLYISNGFDNMLKYDGQTLYRAGMAAGGDADGSGDAGAAPTTAETGSGATFTIGQTFYYKYLYKQVDNKGNIVEGIMSPVSALETIAAATTNLNVTVTNLATTSGFKTGCAIVNGVQAGVSVVTVDSGHTLLAGDTLYVYDTATSGYVTRTVSSVTATTVTFTGGVVSFADNAVISANLRIAIYRTQNGAASTGTYYLVAEIPNDSIGTATQVYVDAIADASLGAEFVTPIKAHGLPPKCKYMTSHPGHLMLAGDPTNVNKVYYSDVDSPEYFPAGDNAFLVDAFDGAKVYGIGSLDASFFVFKDKSIQIVTGDFSEDSFRVDEVSYGQVGCAAHHSIQKVNGFLVFLSKRGIFSVNAANGVQPLGDRLNRKFTKFDVTFNFQKATSVVWADNSKYILFIPNESQDGSSNYYADSDSRMYVYDYSKDAWLPWSGVNAQGGMVFAGERLYFSGRRLDTNANAVRVNTGVYNEYGDSRDYSNHNEAIEFTYSTHWEALGEPNVFKRFSRLKVFALPNDMVEGVVPLYSLDVDQEFNYNSPAIISSMSMDFSGGTTGWGNGEWGNFPWGDSPLLELRGKLKSSKVRSMRLTFSNETILENVLISGYELECIPAYVPNIKE